MLVLSATAIWCVLSNTAAKLQYYHLPTAKPNTPELHFPSLPYRQGPVPLPPVHLPLGHGIPAEVQLPVEASISHIWPSHILKRVITDHVDDWAHNSPPVRKKIKGIWKWNCCLNPPTVLFRGSSAGKLCSAVPCDRTWHKPEPRKFHLNRKKNFLT